MSLLAFCVWMLFSAVAVNLNKVGFQFTTDQLFMLTALQRSPAPAARALRVYGAAVRRPSLDRIQYRDHDRPCVWLGFAVQDTATPFSVFVIISLLCGFAGANFASSMANISFFFPETEAGRRAGYQRRPREYGRQRNAAGCPLVVSLSIFAVFGGTGSEQPDGSHAVSGKRGVDLGAVPDYLHPGGVVLYERPVGVEGLAERAATGTETRASVDYGAALSATLRLVYRLLCGLRHAVENPVSGYCRFCTIFFGPFIGALARSTGGAISDRLGGTRVTLVNFVVMAIFCGLLFLTLPTRGEGGNFIAFFAVFMVLFLTAGLGSVDLQMISVIFRKMTMDRVKAQGGSEAQAMREAATDTAAALGFISAIGAIGGSLFPRHFGISLDLTGSPAGA